MSGTSERGKLAGWPSSTPSHLAKRLAEATAARIASSDTHGRRRSVPRSLLSNLRFSSTLGEEEAFKVTKGCAKGAGKCLSVLQIFQDSTWAALERNTRVLPSSCSPCPSLSSQAPQRTGYRFGFSLRTLV